MEKEECCIDTFSPFKAGVASGHTRWNPDRIMLVRTKAITRTSTGGIDFEEIVESILVKRKNTEEFIQASSTCRMNDQDAFLLSVLDRRENDNDIFGTVYSSKRFSIGEYILALMTFSHAQHALRPHGASQVQLEP